MRTLKLRSNWVNMVIALAACLAVVAIGLAFVPTPKEDQFERRIDYAHIAETSQAGADFRLAVPSLPKGWTSNEAMVKPMGAPAFDTWYVSWVGPERGWMSLRQSAGDAKWVDSLLENYVETAANTVAGQSFTSYDGPEGKQAMVADLGDSRAVLIGRADPQIFEHFAAQLIRQRGESPQSGAPTARP